MRHATALLPMLLATSSIVGLGGLGGCVTDQGAGDEPDETAGFEQAYQDNLGGKDDSAQCSGVTTPDRGPFNKHVFLTFDDGPNPATTPTVIATLHRHHAPATFFNNGMRYGSQAAKDLARQIADDPDFILANHSQHHDNLSLVGAAKVTSEFAATDALIRATGEVPRYFRFPFGAANCAGAQAIRDQGQRIVGWNIDSADWCFAATGGATCKKATFKYVPDSLRNDMKGYILSQIHASKGGIILMHDIHASTANALDGLLTTLEGEDYTFARLDDATLLPRLNQVAPAPQKFIGDACTTDAGCGFTVAGEPGHCHAGGFCTVSCEGSCPDLAGRAPTFCVAEPMADGAAPIAGYCASKAASVNQLCAALPGTTAGTQPRFLGSSGATAAQANVCAAPAL